MRQIAERGAILAFGISSFLNPTLPVQEGLPLCGPNNVQALNEDGSISATDNVTGEECLISAEATTTTTTSTTVQETTTTMPETEASSANDDMDTILNGMVIAGLVGIAASLTVIAVRSSSNQSEE